MSEQSKQSLTNLNDFLFKQIERLSDETLSKENTQQEILKAQAITNVADTIIKNGELALKIALVKQKFNGNMSQLPPMLTDKHGDDVNEKI